MERCSTSLGKWGSKLWWWVSDPAQPGTETASKPGEFNFCIPRMRTVEEENQHRQAVQNSSFRRAQMGRRRWKVGDAQHFSGVMDTLENYRVVVFIQHSMTILKPIKLYNLFFQGIFLHIIHLCGVCHNMLVEVRGQPVGVISLLPLWESHGLNLDHKTWPQGP